jgi:hypothetical protein
MLKINLTKYIPEIEKKIAERIDDATITLLSDVIQKSPVDTWTFLKGNKRTLARREGDKVIGTVYNDSEYAEEVEYGFRSSAVNWHKNRRTGWPIIHTGIWATPFLRAYIENRDSITQKLKW